jgi:hypothetical protein
MTDPALPPGMSPTGASHPSGQGSPSAPTEPTAAAIKRRQVLLLAGIAGTIVAGTLLSVSLTGTKGNDAQPAKPQSTNILAPGAQVDPRDAWRGQADAQLKAIEQRSRDLAQRNAELEGQGKEMLERLKKLEGSGLTPLPPPPVTAPAARPSFGPDRPGNALPDAGPQRFPPPPPPMPQGAVQGAGLPPPPGGVPSMPTPTGIVSIVLGDVATGKGAKPAADAAAASTSQSRHAPLSAQRRLHPGGTSRRPGRTHRRPGAAQPSTGPAAPRRQRDPAQPVPRPREGVLHRRRRLWRREFRARLHPHRVAVVRHPRRHGHRRAGEGLRGRRGRQGRHARTPGLQAGADPRQRPARRRGQRHRSRLHAELHHAVGLAAGHHQHRRPRQAARSRSGHRVWARRWTGSPSTTSASPRRSSR